MAESTFIAVVSDTNPANGGRSYNMTVSGNNMSQFLGKKIGDLVDGIFVGEGDHAGVGVVDVHQGENRQQHEQAADLCEEEKLHRGVGPGLVSPYGDEEIHGDQHDFPEHEEQEQIECGEHADDAGHHPEDVELEEPAAVVDLRPRRDDRDDAEEHGQRDHH